MRGRKPKPAKSLHVIGSPEKPADLPPAAERLWEAITGSLPAHALGISDSAMLEGICRWYALWREAVEAIPTLPADKRPRQVRTAATAWKHFAAAAERFGLSPADRGRLKMYTAADDVDDPILKFLP